MLRWFASKSKIPLVNPWNHFPLLLSKNPELCIFAISISSHSILSWAFSSQAVVSTNPWILCLPVSSVISMLPHQMIPSLSSPYVASWKYLAQSIIPSFLKLFLLLAVGQLLSLFSTYLTGHCFSFSLAGSSASSWPLHVACSKTQFSNLSFLSSFIS